MISSFKQKECLFSCIYHFPGSLIGCFEIISEFWLSIFRVSIRLRRRGIDLMVSIIGIAIACPMPRSVFCIYLMTAPKLIDIIPCFFGLVVIFPQVIISFAFLSKIYAYFSFRARFVWAKPWLSLILSGIDPFILWAYVKIFLTVLWIMIGMFGRKIVNLRSVLSRQMINRHNDDIWDFLFLVFCRLVKIILLLFGFSIFLNCFVVVLEGQFEIDVIEITYQMIDNFLSLLEVFLF